MNHSRYKSKDFGIVVVKEGGFQFEVAQFRNDGKYLDGRKPESVKITGSFGDDAGSGDDSFEKGHEGPGVVAKVFEGVGNAVGEVVDFFKGFFK